MDLGKLKSWAALRGHKTKRRSYGNLYGDLVSAGVAIPAEFPRPKRFRADDHENNDRQEDKWSQTVATIQANLLEQASALLRQERAHGELKAEVLALRAETTNKERAPGELQAEVLALRTETTKKVDEISSRLSAQEKVLTGHTTSLGEITGHLQSVAHMLREMNGECMRRLYTVKESTATVQSMKAWHTTAPTMERKLVGIKWDNLLTYHKQGDVVKVIATSETAFRSFEEAAKAFGIILEKKPDEQNCESNGNSSASSTHK